jgi:hypothetical protein
MSRMTGILISPPHEYGVGLGPPGLEHPCR